MIEIFKTSGGILLCLIPFLLIFGCKDRRRGFLYILTAVISFHIVVALTSQALHLFRYPIILVCHLLAAISTLIVILKNKQKFATKISWRLDSAWLLIAAGAIIFFNLWSVHYYYSGVVNTNNGFIAVSASRYDYPYFSDEWVGVAYTDYSLKQHSLPTVNPLINGASHYDVPNVFVVFFSLLAELFLILNLAPLTGYAIMALSVGLTICYLLYRLMRTSGVAIFPAVIAALSLPYIINGANLPGLWYLLPFSGGMVLFLVSLIALARSEIKVAGWSGLVSLLIYPPFIVFLLPAFAVKLYNDQHLSLKKKLRIVGLAALAIGATAAVIILLQSHGTRDFFALIVSYLRRPVLDNGIASYPIWRILPVWTLPFILIGFFDACRKKLYFLITPFLIGVIFWMVYSYSMNFLIIDYARSVMITSWLAIIFAGLGFDWTEKKLTALWPLFSEPTPRLIIRLTVLILFLIAAGGYTSRNGWTHLKLVNHNPNGIQEYLPAAPASNYLTDEDLAFFKAIPKRSRFISPPWKGLVIGAATGHYPIVSKPSIVSNHIRSYDSFMNGDCAAKIHIGEVLDLSYAYSAPFDCAQFAFIGASREGLHLYQFRKAKNIK